MTIESDSGERNREMTTPFGRRRRLDDETATGTAIAALGFLAADAERLSRFLALSGLGPENLRAAAEQPGFLVGVLAHLLADEPLLHVFAAEHGLAPETVVEAHARLERSGSAG